MTKILVVDDAEFLRVRLTKMLATDGYEVFQAENGLKAVSTYKEIRPEIVLMDVTMPEMDGLAALKEIVSFDAKARVIMLTALGRDLWCSRLSSPARVILSSSPSSMNA